MSSSTFDISQLEALFQEQYEALCVTAFRIVRDKDVAEDVVQDVFVKIWQGRTALAADIQLKAYLFRSTINQSLNYIKKNHNQCQREAMFSEEQGGDINSTDQIMAAKETAERIEAAICALPEGCRTVFVLSRYENLSYKEIASELDISVKTVENQMVKALKHLRRYLLLLLLVLFI